ncbi:MAG: Xaa-Pro peptidase family protein [Clostridia bacterium]|nr:Xaa-Pro peptidase family protein [Clostridia bacterium]
MSKIENIVKVIKEIGADAVLITHSDSRLYASGFISSAGNVFITKNSDAYYLTDSRYLEAAGKELLSKGFMLVDTTSGYIPQINSLIEKHGVKSLIIEDKHITLHEYSTYRDNLSSELVLAGDRFDRLLSILSTEDRDALEKAETLASKALEQTLSVFRIGMTEKELEAELIYNMYMNGADDLSFKPEIISGANASMPHGNPTDKPIIAGDVLLMDFGLVKNGYWSDMSRTFAVSYATDELQRVYYTVLEAQNKAIDAWKVGMTGKELDAVARNHIMQSGIDGCYQHALGHGCGLLGSAPTHLANRFSDDIMETGNCMSFEPGIYQPGKLGCRIEDLVWLGHDGPQNLTHFPKNELIVLK